MDRLLVVAAQVLLHVVGPGEVLPEEAEPVGDGVVLVVRAREQPAAVARERVAQMARVGLPLVAAVTFFVVRFVFACLATVCGVSTLLHP